MKHTIREAIDYYTRTIKLSESSKDSYANVRKRLEEHGYLDYELKQFNGAAMREFLGKLKCAESTRYYIYFLKVKGLIKQYAADHELKATPNLKVIKAPKVNEAMEGEESFLTLNELKSLSEIDLENQPALKYGREMYMTMCWSGMAIGDLETFKPEVNFTKDLKWLEYKRKKNGRLCRVPIFPSLALLVERNQWPLHIGRRMINLHCIALGRMLGKELSSHSGRHTFGCIMLEHGFSIESVSKMMGHSSIEVTQRVYAKVTKDKVMRELEQVPTTLKNMVLC